MLPGFGENMSDFVGDADFSHSLPEGSAVLLTNLGTPDAPTTLAVRRYLAEFLSDPRVVEVPRWLWLPLLHGVILRTRPRRSAKAYQRVWPQTGSPLLHHSKRQAGALEARLRAAGHGVPVRLGMRYGNPSIADALAEFRGQGLARLIVLPLYPQYSATTTGSTFDALSRELRRWRRVPQLAFSDSYHDHPGYIAALAKSVRERWTRTPRAERILFSFHGVPQRYLHAGDPYFCHCHVTARLLAEALDLAPGRYGVAFQSRVGREPWVKPYTDEVLVEWARAGVRSVDVLCPGFSADCLETLEEIDIGERARFLATGGERFRYIPALNDDAAHIEALSTIVTAMAGGSFADGASSARDAAAVRARALGARA